MMIVSKSIYYGVPIILIYDDGWRMYNCSIEKLLNDLLINIKLLFDDTNILFDNISKWRELVKNNENFEFWKISKNDTKYVSRFLIFDCDPRWFSFMGHSRDIVTYVKLIRQRSSRFTRYWTNGQTLGLFKSPKLADFQNQLFNNSKSQIFWWLSGCWAYSVADPVIYFSFPFF